MQRYLFLLLFLICPFALAQTFNGPLRVHPQNPRYFTDNSGKAIYMTGSHTWANFQEIIAGDLKEFDYDAYLAFMKENHHNFMRMWVWEQTERGPWTREQVIYYPHPYERTGPGNAADEKPRFNLDKWNDAYFQRLRDRVIKAGQNGIYVSIMLFQGWALDKTDSKFGDPIGFNPFFKTNNINGLDVPISANDSDTEPTLHSMMVPDILKRQEAYVRKVVDTVNDLDNVLYEIINEGGSIEWQYHMIRYVKEIEAALPKQHPVGMTYRYSPRTSNAHLWDSPADWVSPAKEPVNVTGSVFLQDYAENPPANDGRKVILNDTDHLWGHGGNYRWVWKSFLRGLNPIFMDPWQPIGGGRLDPEKASWMFIGGISLDQRDYPDWDLLRRNMGFSRMYAEKVNLAAMTPRPDLSSTAYCLANVGNEYLIYFPEGGSATLDLTGAEGDFSAEWFFPVINRTLKPEFPIKGGDYTVLRVPFTGDAVLWLKKM